MTALWSPTLGPLAWMRCCRDHLIAIMFPMGRCGACKQRPAPVVPAQPVTLNNPHNETSP